MCSVGLNLVHLVFWPLTVFVIILIARHNRFGLKDTLLAAVGVKKFDRSPAINILSVVTLLLSLGLAVWIIQNCTP